MTQQANLVQLDYLIELQKEESFTNPDTATREEALGILISKWAEWDGQKIMDVFLNALEDANFHSFRSRLLELWEKEVAENFTQQYDPRR